MKRNKAGIAALMLAVLFLVLRIPIYAEDGTLTAEGNMSLTDSSYAEGDLLIADWDMTSTDTFYVEDGALSGEENMISTDLNYGEDGALAAEGDMTWADISNAEGGALTPDGNMSLTDDFTSADGDKQFITVKTADGDYYYIIIDRAGITENVYFLKMVGNSDLPSDAKNSSISPKEQSCTCRDKCTSGHIDTSCTVCVMDSSKCTGNESVTVQEQQTRQQRAMTGNRVPMIGVILLIAMGGAALYFVFKGKKDKETGNRRDDPEDDEDDGDFGAFHPDDDDEEDD